MKRPTIISCIFAFLLSLTLAIGCTTTTANTSGQMTLAFSAWPGWFPWQVAEEAGIFKENKLSVTLKWFDGYTDSLSALATGKVNANSQTLNDTISAISKGADQVVVLVNDNSTGNDQIIVAPGIQTVADLKGKKIAVEEGTVDHYLLLLGLKKAGLAAQDVQIVPLETGTGAAAFVSRQVDAVAAFAPFTTTAIKRTGSKVLFSSKDHPGAISDHLVFTRQFIDQHPDQVQAAVDSWFATLDYINKNQAQADAIMAKQGGVTVPEYRAYASGTKILTLAENLQAFQSGKDNTSLAYVAENLSKFLIEHKLADKQPELAKLFDDRFIKAYAQKAKQS